MNYSGCAKCKSFDIVLKEKVIETDNDDETITYNRKLIFVFLKNPLI